MSILSSKKVKTLAEKIAEVKSTFSKAHQEAKVLQSEIDLELEADYIALADAKKKLEETEKLKQENQKFITNLEKFI